MASKSKRTEKSKTILPRGEYEAVLSGCVEKTSKAGNPMWVATWEVLIPSKLEYGQMRVDCFEAVKLTDYLLKNKPWKLEALCKAWGCIQELEKGEFSMYAHLEQHVTVIVEVEAPMGFEQGNKIAGYKAPPKEKL